MQQKKTYCYSYLLSIIIEMRKECIKASLFMFIQNWLNYYRIIISYYRSRFIVIPRKFMYIFSRWMKWNIFAFWIVFDDYNIVYTVLSCLYFTVHVWIIYWNFCDPILECRSGTWISLSCSVFICRNHKCGIHLIAPTIFLEISVSTPANQLIIALFSPQRRYKSRHTHKNKTETSYAKLTKYF